MEPEKPELFGYYFEIPEKAEVKRVPISMLSSLVQQRIRRLGGRTKAPYVIVVSPIIIQKLPKSHKARTTAAESAAEHSLVTLSDTSQSSNGRSMGKEDKWTKNDLGTYLVPVKCSKDAALTMLRLAQTRNEEKISFESESSDLGNSLVLNHNLQMIKMKAAALYIYKNIMYLLPESKEANTMEEESEAKKSEATEYQARVKLSANSECKHNGLGCVTLRQFSFLQLQDGRVVGSVIEKSATVVKSCNKGRWDLPAEMKSTNAGPSSRSSTVNSLQMSFWEQSERQIKRKLSYVSNEEPFIKKTHQSDSDLKQDSIVAENVLVRSPLQPIIFSSSSSATLSPLGLQESLPSFSPEKTSTHGYLSDSDAKQDSTVPKNIFTPSPIQPHSSPSNAPSPLGPQESSLSFSPEKLCPYGYLSDSDAKQDAVLTISPLQPHSSSLDAPSSLGPQELPFSFSPEKTPPRQQTSDLEGLSSSSSLSCNIPRHTDPTPLGYEPTCADNMSPPHLKAKSSSSSSEFTTGSENSNEPDETSSSSDPSLMFNQLRSEQAFFLDIDETTRDEKRQRLLDRVIELKKKVEEMQQKSS